MHHTLTITALLAVLAQHAHATFFKANLPGLRVPHLNSVLNRNNKGLNRATNGLNLPGTGPQSLPSQDQANTTPSSEGLIAAMRQQVPFCNDIARKWIRAAFHDCGTFDMSSRTGGCDGSLRLEASRHENRGLEQVISSYLQFSSSFGVSFADVTVVGGKLGAEACSGMQLPEVEFGRKDADVSNPPNRLPNPHQDFNAFSAMFVNQLGFSAEETVALIGGAHSVANVNQRNAPELGVNGPLDATPDRMDNAYFRELVAAGGSIAVRVGGKIVIPADRNMLQGPFRVHTDRFAQDEQAMLQAFGRAYQRMLLLGFKDVGQSAPLTALSTDMQQPQIAQQGIQLPALNNSMPALSFPMQPSTVVDASWPQPPVNNAPSMGNAVAAGNLITTTVTQIQTPTPGFLQTLIRTETIQVGANGQLTTVGWQVQTVVNPASATVQAAQATSTTSSTTTSSTTTSTQSSATPVPATTQTNITSGSTGSGQPLVSTFNNGRSAAASDRSSSVSASHPMPNVWPLLFLILSGHMLICQ